MTKWNTRKNCGVEKQISLSLRLRQLIKVQGGQLLGRGFWEIAGCLLMMTNTEPVGGAKSSPYFCYLWTLPIRFVLGDHDQSLGPDPWVLKHFQIGPEVPKTPGTQFIKADISPDSETHVSY